MTKQEISEIKKLFTPKNCSITRICGCYVDGEKNKKTELKQAFLALPEEEMLSLIHIYTDSQTPAILPRPAILHFPDTLINQWYYFPLLWKKTGL